MRGLAQLIRPGDWVTILLGLALAAASGYLVLSAGAAQKAVIRAGGTVLGEMPLNERRTVQVRGPLGVTIVEIEPGRARVAADPGPRQYCVKQGWLTRADSIAVCAPNQVSLELVGKARSHDSLNY